MIREPSSHPEKAPLNRALPVRMEQEMGSYAKQEQYSPPSPAHTDVWPTDGAPRTDDRSLGMIFVNGKAERRPSRDFANNGKLPTRAWAHRR